MSSIRPLITITILVAVGVFLFTKINEGPAPLPPEMESSLDAAPAIGIPPLASDSGPTKLPPAPAWGDPAANSSGDMAATPPAMSPTTLPTEAPPAYAPQSSSTATADLPPIPDLPPIAENTPTSIAPSTSGPPSPVAQAPPIQVPANIPIAQYPGDYNAPTMEPMTPPAALSAQPSAQSEQLQPLPATAEAALPAAPPSSPPSVASDDRYGAIAAAPAVATPEPVAVAPVTPAANPATPTFAAEWPEIQAALQRQELVAAHGALSRWYGNPSLTPAEAQQVEMLLSQLAGTVVYSNEHRLEPPYTVHAGDTLQSIAQRYDVPWQLLAKINGVPASNLVQPGQQLKVVHGPFAAVVQLDKSQLTLTLDGRYAGRFPISVEQGAALNEGQWVLEQKLVQPTTQSSNVVGASYTPAAVEHVLVLRNGSPTAGGATISITSGKSAPTGPTAVAPAAIRLSPRDVEEVADILSVGSPVTIRR